MKQADYDEILEIIKRSDAEDLEEIEGLIKTRWARIELAKLQEVPGLKWAPWGVQKQLADAFFKRMSLNDRLAYLNREMGRQRT